MDDIYGPPRFPPSPTVWPPDDTEESVAGTVLHQTTIVNLRWGINGIAGALTRPGKPVPWRALHHMVVKGFKRPDGSRYTTMPDVLVYRRPIAPRRASLALVVDGPPALIVEVLDESTYDVDLDLEKGKGFSYARGGVQEYLALDPDGVILPERVRAWRLGDGAYRPWEPAPDGRWYSETISVAFGIEDLRAAVYARNGERQPREGEFGSGE